MCLRRRTWVRLHGWVLVALAAILVVVWGQLILIGMQLSQDGINATIIEQMRENRYRVERLETWRDTTDERLNRLTWLAGVASGPLILEIFKYLIRSRREKPNRIYERRVSDHDDDD